MDESVLREVGFHFTILDVVNGNALPRLASAGDLLGTEGGEDGAAHGCLRGALLRPYFPLSEALRKKHLDAGDGGDSFFCGELQELRLLGAVDQVHHDAAVQFAGRERRNSIVRVHADRSGVEDGVKKFRAQSATRDDFSLHGAGQFFGGFVTAGANSDDGTSASERERSGARGAARSKDQRTASFDSEFFLQRAKNTYVIRVATVERAVAAN